jgi:HEAT repeat protein
VPEYVSADQCRRRFIMKPNASSLALVSFAAVCFTSILLAEEDSLKFQPIGKYVPKLVSDLERKDAGTAVRELLELGPRAKAAAPALVRYLKIAPIGYQGDVAIALGRIGESSSIPALLAELPNMHVRNQAAAHVALLMLGHEPEKQLSRLIVILRDNKVRESIDLGHVLGYIRELGAKGSALLPTLRDMTNVEPHSVRATLARLGDEPEKHVAWLTKELDGAACGEAAYALGEIGPKAAPAVPRMVALMTEAARTTGNLRFTLAITGIGAPAAKPLAELLGHEHRSVRMHAAIALRVIGADAKDTLPLIIGARRTAKDKDQIQDLDFTIKGIKWRMELQTGTEKE